MESFIELFGLDPTAIAILIPVIIASGNFFKRVLDLKGKQNLIAIGIMSAVFSVLVFHPDIWAVLSGMVVTFVLSSGLWETGKILAHKRGTPSTRESGQ